MNVQFCLLRVSKRCIKWVFLRQGSSSSTIWPSFSSPHRLCLSFLSSSCRAGNLLIHTVNDGAVQICALRDARQVHVVRTTPLKEIFNPHFDVNKSGISTVSIFFFFYRIGVCRSSVQNIRWCQMQKCGKRERCNLLCSRCVFVGGCLLFQHEITTYYQDGGEKRNCTVTKWSCDSFFSKENKIIN